MLGRSLLRYFSHPLAGKTFRFSTKDPYPSPPTSYPRAPHHLLWTTLFVQQHHFIPDARRKILSIHLPWSSNPTTLCTVPSCWFELGGRLI